MLHRLNLSRLYKQAYRIERVSSIVFNSVSLCRPSLACRTMCILFCFVDQERNSTSGYRLIIANNRDEGFSRPTENATFWGEDGHIISSRDQEKAREGGSWLALSKKGRLSVLLNILTTNMRADAKGRGQLVPDFVSSSLSGQEYLTNVASCASDFNGFNLFTLEKKNDTWDSWYFSNVDNSLPVPYSLTGQDFIFCGNSLIDRPWKKVAIGGERFLSIARSELNDVSKRDELVGALLEFLSDPRPFDTPGHEDEQLRSQAEKAEYPEERSSLCVHIPQIGYGTRTNTVILIDSSDECYYVERNLVDPSSYRWETRTFSFKMNTT